ncbi:hypothetical protein OYC64_020481 [Pagothenia borchgrevinki]|uniref:Uncharacterized protein n=1 Tax=Pagothenia borchgrevinki TaxID=8213 RepID=A0ABD2FLK1_PAGBO
MRAPSSHNRTEGKEDKASLSWSNQKEREVMLSKRKRERVSKSTIYVHCANLSVSPSPPFTSPVRPASRGRGWHNLSFSWRKDRHPTARRV